MKSFIGGGQAAIQGRLQDDFFDLSHRYAIIERGFYVHFKLRFPIQRNEHRHRDQASAMFRQIRPSPDFAPSVVRNKVLKVNIKRIDIATCFVYVCIAQYGATNVHSLVVCGFSH